MQSERVLPRHREAVDLLLHDRLIGSGADAFPYRFDKCDWLAVPTGATREALAASD